MVLLYLLLSSSFSTAAIIVGDHEVTDEQLLVIQKNLPVSEKEYKFYHWTHVAQGMRWAKQRHVDAGEVKFYNTPQTPESLKRDGNLQVYGPGVYLAESSDSSTAFGSYPIVFKIPAGTPIYDPNVLRNVLGWTPNNLEISKLGEYIPFIRKVGQNDWWLTHHPKNTQDINYAAVEGGPSYTKISPILSDDTTTTEAKLVALKELKTNEGMPVGIEDEYLEKMVSLLNYQDHISLIRSKSLNPTEPWSHFDQENFKHFHSWMGLMRIGNKIAPEAHENGVLGANKAKDAWIAYQLEDWLIRIFKKISGQALTNINPQTAYRTETIRGGGDGPKNKFYATPVQLAELKKNPYLKVSAKSADDGMGFWVSYLYPGVTNYKGVEEKLSPQLRSELHALPAKDQLKIQKTHDLNQKIVLELLHDLFSRHYGTLIDYELFQRELISIHPFSDFNGRTVRIYSEIISCTGGPKAPEIAWSDFDLLMPIATQKAMNQVSNQMATRLRKSCLEEMTTARLTGRIPDYCSLPDFGNLAKPLNILSPEKNLTLSPNDWEDIRTRNLVKVLNQNFGHGWDIHSFTALADASELAKMGNLKAYEHFLFENQDEKIIQILEKTQAPLDLEALHRFKKTRSDAQSEAIAQRVLTKLRAKADYINSVEKAAFAIELFQNLSLQSLIVLLNDIMDKYLQSDAQRNFDKKLFGQMKELFKKGIKACEGSHDPNYFALIRKALFSHEPDVRQATQKQLLTQENAIVVLREAAESSKPGIDAFALDILSKRQDLGSQEYYDEFVRKQARHLTLSDESVIKLLESTFSKRGDAATIFLNHRLLFSHNAEVWIPAAHSLAQAVKSSISDLKSPTYPRLIYCIFDAHIWRMRRGAGLASWDDLAAAHETLRSSLVTACKETVIHWKGSTNPHYLRLLERALFSKDPEIRQVILEEMIDREDMSTTLQAAAQSAQPGIDAFALDVISKKKDLGSEEYYENFIRKEASHHTLSGESLIQLLETTFSKRSDIATVRLSHQLLYCEMDRVWMPAAYSLAQAIELSLSNLKDPAHLQLMQEILDAPKNRSRKKGFIGVWDPHWQAKETLRSSVINAFKKTIDAWQDSNDPNYIALIKKGLSSEDDVIAQIAHEAEAQVVPATK